MSPRVLRRLLLRLRRRPGSEQSLEGLDVEVVDALVAGGGKAAVVLRVPACGCGSGDRMKPAGAASPCSAVAAAGAAPPPPGAAAPPCPCCLAEVSREALAAHAEAEEAAAAAAAAPHGHAALDVEGGEPISRIASWISGLPEASSTAEAASLGPEPSASLSTHASSLGRHDFEAAAADPGLVRPSEWASTKGSDEEGLDYCCCGRFGAVFAAVGA
ncbi:hypothetical protein HT031_002345 [Scenedesmus sp. PABB004]|nr:hypothetical protein HT031_002345 [Scenedesmus sp. PABB004]